MNNRYCMLCGTLLPEDGVCLRCGTKYKLSDDGQMTVIPRKVKRVSAKVTPKKRVFARIVLSSSETDTQPIPDLKEIYSFSEEAKQQQAHVDWTDYSEEENVWDDPVEPNFVLIDEDEMDWNNGCEEESLGGEPYEPDYTQMDYDDFDDYDDDPVFDDIYVSTTTKGHTPVDQTSRKASKKKHPLFKTMLILLLCGGIVYLYNVGVFTPFTSPKNSPRTVSVRSSLKTTEMATKETQTTTEATSEESTKGPNYEDVALLSKVTSNDYTVYASYDLSNKTLKTNNWERYLAEDDAYNTCIQSRQILDSASSKDGYLDYIIFFAPYNKNILNGMITKVVEENGNESHVSNLSLDEKGRLKSIKSSDGSGLVETADYEYTNAEIVIHYGGGRFVMDQIQKPDNIITVTKNNDKVTRYVIESMGDLVTAEISYDAGRIKHVKTTTKYYVYNPDDYDVTHSYSGINVSDIDLFYSTYSVPVYE